MMLRDSYKKALVASVVTKIRQIENRLHTESAKAMLIEALRDLLRRDVVDRIEVIDSAIKGDEIAHAALTAEFDHCTDHRLDMPTTLASYGLHEGRRFKRRRGGSKWDHISQQIGVVLLAYLTSIENNLLLTRNDATERESGASIVAAALAQCGFKEPKEKTINNWITQWGDLTLQMLVKHFFTSR